MWPHYSSTNPSAASGSNGNTLGKDEFLTLLITQLQYQDPLKPMENTEFIAQMAQFTSLEQLLNIGNEIAMMRQSLGLVSGLIGRQVTWVTYNETGSVTGEKTGTVDAIVVKEGEQYAKIGEDEIPLSQIIRIESAQGEQPS